MCKPKLFILFETFFVKSIASFLKASIIVFREFVYFSQNPHKNQAPLRSQNFVNKGFFGVQGKNTVNPLWIHEYFNDVTAKNTCFKI